MDILRPRSPLDFGGPLSLPEFVNGNLATQATDVEHEKPIFPPNPIK